RADPTTDRRAPTGAVRTIITTRGRSRRNRSTIVEDEFIPAIDRIEGRIIREYLQLHSGARKAGNGSDEAYLDGNSVEGQRYFESRIKQIREIARNDPDGYSEELQQEQRALIEGQIAA